MPTEPSDIGRRGRSSDPQALVIFLQNVPWRANDEDVRQFVRLRVPQAEVQWARIAWDRQRNRSLGFAHAHLRFNGTFDPEEVCRLLDGQFLAGREIRAEPAHDQGV